MQLLIFRQDVPLISPNPAHLAAEPYRASGLVLWRKAVFRLFAQDPYRTCNAERSAFVGSERHLRRPHRQFADQGLESADIALDDRRIERYDLAVALQGVLAEQLAQPEEGLAQVLLGLRVEMRAPQQRGPLLARLRRGAVQAR